MPKLVSGEHEETVHFPPADPDLRAVIEGWTDLPEAIKAGIVAMIRASKDDLNDSLDQGGSNYGK